jgi:hypothetical protein
MRTLLVLVSFVLVSGCRDNIVLKPLSPDVQMTLKVSPSAASPGHPARIAAQVVNSGVTPIWREGGCSYWGGIARLSVIDPLSNRVNLWNPLTLPLCPDGRFEFSPGARLNAAAIFDGTLYTDSGIQENALDGVYTFIVIFSSWQDGRAAGATTNEQLITVTWSSK